MKRDKPQANSSMPLRKFSLSEDRAIGDHAYGGFILCLIVLLGTMGFALLSLDRSNRDVGWVEHSGKVQLQLNQLLVTLLNAQTAKNGYLITGQEDYLQRYHDSMDETAAQLQLVRDTTTDDAKQQGRLDRLDKLIQTHFTEMATTIVARERDGLNAASDAVIRNRPKRTMPSIRDTIDEMLVEETSLRNARRAVANRSRSLTLATISTGIALCILTAGFSVWRIRLEFEYRRTAHQTLRESEGRFRELAESIDAVFWIASPDGQQMLYVSRSYEDIWGMPCESLYAHPESRVDAIHPDDRPDVAPLLLTPADAGVFDITYRVERTDGTIRWVRDRGFPVRDNDGQVVRVVGIAQDMTDRKKAEEALRMSEERFAQAQEAVNFGISDWDIPNDILFCDERYAAIFGVDPAWPMLSRADWFARIHPEDRERAQHELLLTLTENRPYNTEYRIVRPDGTIRWVTVQAKFLRDESGDPMRAIGAVADITERKDAEIALRDNHAFTRMWLDKCTDGIWDWNLMTDDEYYSPSFKGLLGYADDEIPNRAETWRSLVHPLDLPLVLEAFTAHTEEGTPFNLPIRYLHKNGSVLWVMCRGVALQNAEEQYTRMVGTYTDITRLKQVETELQRARDGLEATVRSRTADLQRTNEELEQFAYAASHDLKTPLVTFLGFLSMLDGQLDGGDHDGAKDSIERMQRAAGKMQRLIDDLLEISRIGRVTHDAEPVDIALLAREFVDANAPLIEEASIRIEIEATAPVLLGDPTRLRQVMHNLLTNAVKYGCGSEGGVITVGGRVNDDEVCFYVSDQGPGIDMQYQEKIFGLFQRLDSSTSGTGVGLAIVRRAIECQGGRVWVESEPGRGATFWVSLPNNQLMSNAA